MVTIDALRQAQQFATLHHVLRNQQMYGVLPYTHHLQDVDAVLVRFGYAKDEALRVSAWLHDVVEDCGVKSKQIEEQFGEEVAAIVSAVTNEPGANRKARHAATYPKIRSTPKALVLKLADRIANVEAGGALVRMYRKEHEDFQRMLYTAGEYEVMWNHLNSLLLTE